MSARKGTRRNGCRNSRKSSADEKKKSETLMNQKTMMRKKNKRCRTTIHKKKSRYKMSPCDYQDS
jgi:hypothetical protein